MLVIFKCCCIVLACRLHPTYWTWPFLSYTAGVCSTSLPPNTKPTPRFQTAFCQRLTGAVLHSSVGKWWNECCKVVRAPALHGDALSERTRPRNNSEDTQQAGEYVLELCVQYSLKVTVSSVTGGNRWLTKSEQTKSENVLSDSGHLTLFNVSILHYKRSNNVKCCPVH